VVGKMKKETMLMVLNKMNFSKYIGTEKSKQDALKGKNKRNVWTVTTKPCKEAHFATFPKDLIEPCIKAGCPENGIVFDPFGGSWNNWNCSKVIKSPIYTYRIKF
jgi:DNA modification methylase